MATLNHCFSHCFSHCCTANVPGSQPQATKAHQPGTLEVGAAIKAQELAQVAGNQMVVSMFVYSIYYV